MSLRRWETWASALCLLVALGVLWHGARQWQREAARKAALSRYYGRYGLPTDVLGGGGDAASLPADPWLAFVQGAIELERAQATRPGGHGTARAYAERAARRYTALLDWAAARGEPALEAAARCGLVQANLLVRLVGAAGGGKTARVLAAQDAEAFERELSQAKKTLPFEAGVLGAALTLAQGDAEGARAWLPESGPGSARARGPLLARALLGAEALARLGRFEEAAAAIAPALWWTHRDKRLSERLARLFAAWLTDRKLDRESRIRAIAAVERAVLVRVRRARSRREEPLWFVGPRAHARVLHGLGVAKLLCGQVEAALRDLTAAYRKLGDKDDRRRHGALAIRIGRDLGVAYAIASREAAHEEQRAAFALRGAKKLLEVIAYLRSAKTGLEGAESELGALELLAATLYVNAGYAQEAEKLLQTFVQRGGERDGRWWRLHAIALDLGRAKDAEVIAAYEQALAQSAGHRLEAALRERLERLRAKRRRAR